MRISNTERTGDALEIGGIMLVTISYQLCNRSQSLNHKVLGDARLRVKIK